MTIDMFVDILICGFQIIRDITKVNKYFVDILISWIALLTKNMKLNVQQIKMISQYLMGTIEQFKACFCCCFFDVLCRSNLFVKYHVPG